MKKFDTPSKVNAMLSNIVNLSQEDNDSEDEEMQNLFLPQGPEIHTE